MLLWMAVAALAASETDCATGAPGGGIAVVERSHPGGWRIHETADFQIWSRSSVVDGAAVARQCEAWRAALQTNWVGGPSPGSWNPKCQVVAHATVEEYNQALGSLNDRSVGCTTLKIDQGRVVCRRIDLRADAAGWTSSALPHELTHVVIADRLDRRNLPPWADEGMAALAEPEDKQALRLAALERARDRGRVYRVRDLLRLRQPPRPDYRDAFYGQSVSLVRFLVQRETPLRFVEFAETAAEIGHDAALRTVYSIRNAEHLEQEWRSWTLAQAERDRPAVRPTEAAAVQVAGAGRGAVPTQE